LNLKAKFEGVSSYFGFKRSVPGAFNVGLKGSTCTALPGQGDSGECEHRGEEPVARAHAVAPQLGIEINV
jgi:hypothetical protein